MSPNRRVLITSLKIADLLVISIALVLAVALSQGARDFSQCLHILELRVKLQNALFVLAYLLFWHITLRAGGTYRSYRLTGPGAELRDIALCVLIGFSPLVLVAWPLRFEFVTPPFLLCFPTLAFLGLATLRLLLRLIAHQIRRHGRNLRNVVIVGPGAYGLHLAAEVAGKEDRGYRVVRVLDSQRSFGGNGNDLLQEFDELVVQRPIDELFVSPYGGGDNDTIRELIAACEQQGITVRLQADIGTRFWLRAVPDEVDGQPVLTIHRGPPDSAAFLVKRTLDVAASLVGLAISAPFLALAAIAIKLESDGPVFFVQERVGFNRRRFRAYKLRTMFEGSEGMQAELEDCNEADGPVFKIRDDPRITRLGRFLRRSSIDELPQLLNVLKGEMSLVGPRPLPLRDMEKIDVRWHRRRFSVKPGITCLWQVNSREPKFDDWVKMDMEYIDNWSLALDFRILLKTIPAVLIGHGAH